jgi:hypothetical protein
VAASSPQWVFLPEALRRVAVHLGEPGYAKRRILREAAAGRVRARGWLEDGVPCTLPSKAWRNAEVDWLAGQITTWWELDRSPGVIGFDWQDVFRVEFRLDDLTAAGLSPDASSKVVAMNRGGHLENRNWEDLIARMKLRSLRFNTPKDFEEWCTVNVKRIRSKGKGKPDEPNPITVRRAIERHDLTKYVTIGAA